MAIAFGAIGAKSAGGTTTVSVAHPASVGAGDLLIAGRVSWNAMTHTAESGWALRSNLSGGTGTAADAHTTRSSISTREAAGGETGSITFDQAGTSSGALGVMARYTKASGNTWSIAEASGTDDTHGADRSVTTGTIDLAPGDVLVAVMAVDTDTSLTITSPTFSASGITFGTVTRRTSGVGVTTGNDGNIELFDVPITAGTGTVAVTFAITTATSQCGPVSLIRLREMPPFATFPAADASGPPVLKATQSGAVTTASFTPTANAAIVVGYTSDGDATATSTISNTGGLTFTEVAKRHKSNPAGSDEGHVALWVAKSGSSPSAMTVTCDNGDAVSRPQMLVVRVYDPSDVDADDPIGALAADSFSTGTTLSASLTPETTDGGLRMIWLDWNATGIPTSFLPNNTDTGLVDALHEVGGSTNVQIGKGSPTTTGVAETVGATLLSSATQGNWIAYELRAPAGGGGAASGTGTLSLSGTAGVAATGTATGALALSGSAGARGAAVATGALALSGAATAGHATSATGVLSLSGTSEASGAVPGEASGTGTLSLSGTAGTAATAVAAGSLTLTGAAAAAGSGATSGALALSGSASAAGRATATGSLTLSGAASAGARVTAVAATVSMATLVPGVGAGTVVSGGGPATLTLVVLPPTVSGESSSGAASGTGALSLSGTAGATAATGATGALSLSGAASSAAPAAATGSLGLSGTAGARGPVTATGSLGLSGTAGGGATTSASGTLVLSGFASLDGEWPATASGALSLSGSAGGVAPGIASGTVSLSGSAGARSPLAASGSLSLNGEAGPTGRASAAGNITLSGTAVAVSDGTVSGSGVLTLVGTAGGTTTVIALGHLDLSGLVQLTRAPVLACPVAYLRPNGTGTIRPSTAVGSIQPNTARGRILTC